MVDYTSSLLEFCAKYKVKLIGEYNNVKKTTPIFFECSGCGKQVKKSYGTLTEYGFTDVSAWSGICTQCFVNAHH